MNLLGNELMMKGDDSLRELFSFFTIKNKIVKVLLI